MEQLSEIALLFLRLGVTAFGGPAAHIAIMEHEVVRRRGWLTREQFLDYLGATNLIPGPNSTELAIHIGHARAGWPGLLVAGAAFILPSTLIVGAIAWTYVRYETLPAAAGLFYGVKPVVVAIVVHALWRLGGQALKTIELSALALASVLAITLGAHELAVLAAAGIVAAAGRAIHRRRKRQRAAVVVLGLGGSLGSIASAGALGSIASPGAVAIPALATAPGLWPMFLAFAKIGSVLFGSGYVLLAFLRADFVERFGWLTERQLIDATAVGQVTPGPVFTTATFIGYILAGPWGAVVGTVGIFLPAFVFVALSGPLVPRMRRSPVAGAVLDGVNVASLAFMAVVTFHLGKAVLVDSIATVACVLSLIVLARYQLSSAWLLVAGGLLGLVTKLATG